MSFPLKAAMANTIRDIFVPRATNRKADSRPVHRSVGSLARFLAGYAVLFLFAPACVPLTDGGLAFAQPSPLHGSPPGPAAGPPILTEREDADIRWYSMILTDPATDPAIRSGAAERLRDMRRPQAIDVLAAGLTGGDTSVLLAVIDAMNSSAEPIAGLLLPAVEALRTVPEQALELLAGALAKYGEEGVGHVAVLARNGEAPMSERLNAVHALGVFRLRVAAVDLMALLDSFDAAGATTQNAELLAAVCAALHRGTGLPYGTDVEHWRRWWADARHQPQEEWLTKMVQRLSEQLADTSQQVRRERESAQQIERRLVAFLRDQFPLLPAEEQLRQLPAMIDDPLQVVREFGMDRVSRMLRDAVRIPDEVQHKLAERLNDDVPRLRLQAGRLLEQLNVEGLSLRLARRLSVETSSDVAGGFLDIIARRAPLAANASALLEHVQPWTTHATLGQRAAAAAWELVVTGEAGAHDEPTLQVRDAARTVVAAQLSPPHARLLAYVGDADDLRRLEDLLDSDDRALRRHVAEGFARRGVRRPLIDRADDDVIYPFAIRSLKNAIADMAALARLTSLRPGSGGEENTALWLAAIGRIAENIPRAHATEADDLLASIAEVPAQLRIDALRRHLTEPPDPADPPDGEWRADLATRLADLLISGGRHQEAHEALEQFNGLPMTRSLRAVKFDAAALSGQYAAAAQITSGPGPWIDLLVKTVERDPELAAALRDEIAERFEGRLPGEMEVRFQRVSEHLRNLTTERANGQEV
jgi:hypothetical protein